MNPDDPRDRADAAGDIVALLRAYQLGDEAAFEAVCGDDPRLAMAVGMLNEEAAARRGRSEWERACREWTPGRQI